MSGLPPKEPGPRPIRLAPRVGFVVLGLLLAGGSAPAGALTLSLVTATPSLPVGGSLSVDLVIAGLAAPGSPSLGAFDVDVSFDPARITFVSVTFPSPSALAPSGPAGSIQGSGLSGGNEVDVNETSFESPATLNASQPASFTLATIQFTAAAAGTTSLAFTQIVLADENGAPLTLSAAPAALGIEIPEPGLTGLLAAGVALAAATRRRAARA
jgi:hypothetical protein